jgi:hypothetical protein
VTGISVLTPYKGPGDSTTGRLAKSNPCSSKTATSTHLIVGLRHPVCMQSYYNYATEMYDKKIWWKIFSVVA